MGLETVLEEACDVDVSSTCMCICRDEWSSGGLCACSTVMVITGPDYTDMVRRVVYGTCARMVVGRNVRGAS